MSAVGNTVMPQFTNPNVELPNPPVLGQIVLASGSLVSVATLNRLGVDPSYSGLIIPAIATSGADPTWAVQNGMIYYDSTNNRFRVRIANAWKTIKLA